MVCVCVSMCVTVVHGFIYFWCGLHCGVIQFRVEENSVSYYRDLRYNKVLEMNTAVGNGFKSIMHSDGSELYA